MLQGRIRTIPMINRTHFNIKNQKKDSPIKKIFEVTYDRKKEVQIICKGSGYNRNVENFLHSMFPQQVGAIYNICGNDDNEIGVWCSANIKEVAIALGSEYLSLSVLKELGIIEAKDIKRAGFFPPLYNLCLASAEKLYWENNSLFKGTLKTKPLPAEVVTHLTFIRDTEEKVKAMYEGHEMSKEIDHDAFPRKKW